MDAKDWRFPMACRVCKAVTAFPYRTQTQKNEVVLELLCYDCLHEWVISAPQPLMFRPKPDRRLASRLAN
jgi:hypothetical protein